MSFYSDKYVAVFSVVNEVYDLSYMYTMSVEEYNESWESSSTGCVASPWFFTREEAEEYGKKNETV